MERYIILNGGLFYNQMSINQKINFKKESYFFYADTIKSILLWENYKLSRFK